jgi:hypothetical protein
MSLQIHNQADSATETCYPQGASDKHRVHQSQASNAPVYKVCAGPVRPEACDQPVEAETSNKQKWCDQAPQLH